MPKACILIVVSLLVIFQGLLGFYQQAVAVYTNLCRHSTDYVLVAGSREVIDYAGGSSRNRSGSSATIEVSYEYGGIHNALRWHELLVSDGELKQMIQSHGYVPVRVHKQNPYRAAVDRAITWFALFPAAVGCLYVLGGGVWFTYGVYKLTKEIKKSKSKRRRF